MNNKIIRWVNQLLNLLFIIYNKLIRLNNQSNYFIVHYIYI